ncbi:hypothetical protein BEK98_36950 [Streptomyces diastatochromogenes]|uniref:Uncharacterized protein n=1 Tax=Streptomyces diastatochromogenes TaxID=42236 RepID=A0A233S1U9_STRDA|nr:hypothetical protein BEK98_36950 [Streptomyces diastatochromogenes]
MIAGGDEGAVADKHAFSTEALLLLEGKLRLGAVNDPVGVGFEMPDKGASCRSVRLIRQDAATRSRQDAPSARTDAAHSTRRD